MARKKNADKFLTEAEFELFKEGLIKEHGERRFTSYVAKISGLSYASVSRKFKEKKIEIAIKDNVDRAKRVIELEAEIAALKLNKFQQIVTDKISGESLVDELKEMRQEDAAKENEECERMQLHDSHAKDAEGENDKYFGPRYVHERIIEVGEKVNIQFGCGFKKNA